MTDEKILHSALRDALMQLRGMAATLDVSALVQVADQALSDTDDLALLCEDLRGQKNRAIAARDAATGGVV